MQAARTFFFDAPNGWEQPATSTHPLEVLAWGEDHPADAPVAVCVHGLTRNAHDFLWIAEELSRTHRVYALSMAGRGGSARFSESLYYNYGTYLQDCLAFLQTYSLTQVDWIGTSMGGILGMMVTATAPERIRSLVINDIGHIVPASALQRVYSYAGEPHLFDDRADCEAYLREVLTPWRVPAHAWPTLFTHSIIQLASGKFSPACDPDILAAVKFATEDFTKVEDVSLEAYWAAITCPTLVLHGLESDIFPQAIADAMCAAPHVHYQAYAGIGHAPSLMEPQQIAHVCDWIRTR